MKGLAVLLAVVVGALVGFYGGFHTGKGAASASTPTVTLTPAGTSGPSAATGASGASGSSGGRAAGGGGGGFGGGGRGTAGVVSNVTATGFTIHNAATGADVKVVYDPAVAVRKTDPGVVADIKEGATVAVGGQVAADGTVTATTVTIIPVPPGSGG